jgi:hypothetical protein
LVGDLESQEQRGHAASLQLLGRPGLSALRQLCGSMSLSTSCAARGWRTRLDASSKSAKGRLDRFASTLTRKVPQNRLVGRVLYMEAPCVETKPKNFDSDIAG